MTFRVEKQDPKGQVVLQRSHKIIIISATILMMIMMKLGGLLSFAGHLHVPGTGL